MSTSVAERSREFGVMQTLGATPRRIVGIVVAEGLFVCAASWVGAFGLAAVLSYVLGTVVGTILFDRPLALVLAPTALGAWLLLTSAACAMAAAVPAAAAARVTIRESLAYA